jgi:hypothetical protein
MSAEEQPRCRRCAAPVKITGDLCEDCLVESWFRMGLGNPGEIGWVKQRGAWARVNRAPTTHRVVRKQLTAI